MEPILEFDLLRTFAEVADTRNFTRAAERLNRVQSAISSQIKRLEKLVGAQLFDRSRRSVKLTKEGEVLLSYAHRILRLSDAAFSDLGSPPNAGRVRLGVSDHSACFMPAALSKFAKTDPDVQIEIQCSRSWEVLDDLENGEIDLALVTQHCGRSGGEIVRRERLVWAAAPSSNAPQMDPLPLAIFGPGCVYRQAALSALEASGRQWRMAYNSPSRDGLLIAVTAGLAVTVAPVSTVGSSLKVLDARHGLPELPSMELSLHIAARGITRPAERLASVIRETLSEPLAA